jgi:hypothetical protein
MKRIVSAALLACLLAVSAATLSADSRPALSGQVAGIELCPQSICGFALFVGQFEGELNSRDASGAFVGAITHEPLPEVFGMAALTGGSWTIKANRRLIQGDVVGGAIFNIDGTRYCVEMQMDITDGGRGELHFTGLLDHNPFPPTIGGLVTQDYVGCAAFLASLPS